MGEMAEITKDMFPVEFQRPYQLESKYGFFLVRFRWLEIDYFFILINQINYLIKFRYNTN
jgi:hypothetical protein